MRYSDWNRWNPVCGGSKYYDNINDIGTNIRIGIYAGIHLSLFIYPTIDSDVRHIFLVKMFFTYAYIYSLMRFQIWSLLVLSHKQASSKSCHEASWKGFDNENNHCGCGWDGGDCCVAPPKIMTTFIANCANVWTPTISRSWNQAKSATCTLKETLIVIQKAIMPVVILMVTTAVVQQSPVATS